MTAGSDAGANRLPLRREPPSLRSKLILASASPRRKEILNAAGILFDAVPAEIAELRQEQEAAENFARRLAEEKARAVLARLPQPFRKPILGADTIVVVDDGVLGKPASPEDACSMLRMLSGREHRVLTGVCLLCQTEGVPRGSQNLWRDVQLAVTTVRFASLSEDEIRQYVATGEPVDKAGAYAIQGQAGKWVERIEGCYFNVVGLPIALVWTMLKRLDRTLCQSEPRIE